MGSLLQTRTMVLLVSFLSLACAGLGEEAGPVLEPEAPVPLNDSVSTTVQSGCNAVAEMLERTFTQSPHHTTGPDGVCNVESRGRVRQSIPLVDALINSLHGWKDAGRLAADGADGTQFARRKGSDLCVIGIFWDRANAETADKRVTVSCGPESHWP